MALLVKHVPIVTDGLGVAAATVRGATVLRGIELTLGTLSTPDIDITDDPSGRVILSVNGVATDKFWVPTLPGTDDTGADVAGSALAYPVIGRIQIDITGGGASKTGELTLLYER